MSLELEIAPLAYAQVEADWLPGYQPYAYQWQVYQRIAEALAQRETRCLLLVTPTGSGKTLASYAYSIRNGLPVLGVYPTNELIRDQERALQEEYLKVKGWQDWVLRVDSRQLDEWGLELEEPAHAETLETLLNWRRVILTNPDILYYIAFGRYPKRKDRPGQRERLFALLGSTYRLWVFDEFHLYNVKQMADVAFLIGALQTMNPGVGRVFVFASATPELEVRDHLENKLGLPVEAIETEPTSLEAGRIIAHPVRLTVLPADLERWQGVETLLEQAGLLDEFLSQYPQARVVTILDSVVGAIRLAQAFRDRYPDRPVGEVHGFSSEVQRSDALRQSITVGTSTIEVGVDFVGEMSKDVLIFEARTAAQFIQRFGRLARHAKDRNVPNWAVALVPEYVYHALATKATETQTPLTRQALYAWIEEAYRARETFPRYLYRHAPVEFAEAKNFLKGLFQPDARERIIPALAGNIERLTGCPPGVAMARWRQYYENEIIWPLLTFRGTGFEAAILDERGMDPGFPARRYNLMFLLRRGVFEELDEETFQAELERLAQQRPEWAEEAERERRLARTIGRKPGDLLGVYGFFRLRGLLEQGRRLWFEVDEETVWGRKEQVTIIHGLALCTDPPLPLPRLSRVFRRKKLVAWFTDRHPMALLLGRALPPLFEIYPLRLRSPGGRIRKATWSITFNQNAFFLESSMWRQAKDRKEVIII